MNTIKDFLHEKNMTQAELAERLGYRQSHISMIINGERDITDGFRWRWVEAFGPSSVRFLNGGNDAKP